ncbi:MAG: hypothetical protein V8S14_01080 [Lachnospiraceae bacterium]
MNLGIERSRMAIFSLTAREQSYLLNRRLLTIADNLTRIRHTTVQLRFRNQETFPMNPNTNR